MTNKTQPRPEQSVQAYLDAVEPKQRRDDALLVLNMMKKVTGDEPKMWGDSIVGFGSYHYKYASGREGDWMRIGFSPRKTSLSIYIMSGFDHVDSLMDKLGKFTTGKSCLYVKKLTDIDSDILIKIMKASLNYMKKNYPE
ncbi:DUF1801 domain-containing protein [Pleionea sediminis]|uniref:DUF1801 domain-containing protein n=1 Tax=Pleionea sediminis TaxID=2569479 RepID=UPI001186C625|nr:DUF1801 domain-containing protein [Pleionea sediminis]